MKKQVQIRHSLWGGANDIKKMANHLQVTIQEYTPDPDNHSQLTEPLSIQCKQGNPLLTLSIVRDNPTNEESINNSQSWDIQIAQQASVKDAQHRQHYRALLNPIPNFLLGQYNTKHFRKDRLKEEYLVKEKVKQENNNTHDSTIFYLDNPRLEHLISCQGRQLWQGDMAYTQPSKKLTKGYLIITDDDLLLLFAQPPGFNKALDIMNISTIDLAQYHTILPKEKDIIIADAPTYQVPTLTLTPTKAQYDTLLYILRYATQRYYTLAENTLLPLKRLDQAPPRLPQQWSKESLTKISDTAIFTGHGGTITYQNTSQPVTGYITASAILHLFTQGNHICALPLHPACYKPTGKKGTSHAFTFDLTPVQEQKLGSPTLTLIIDSSRHQFIGWLYHSQYTTMPKPLNLHLYHMIQCTVSCQGWNDAPYIFYCYVNKYQDNNLSYQGLSRKLQHYFGTPPPQASAIKSARATG